MEIGTVSLPLYCTGQAVPEPALIQTGGPKPHLSMAGIANNCISGGSGRKMR